MSAAFGSAASIKAARFAELDVAMQREALLLMRERGEKPSNVRVATGLTATEQRTVMVMPVPLYSLRKDWEGF